MDLPKRKQIRLPDFDYSQNRAYFITICTKDRQRILWNEPVGTTIGRPPLSDYGLVADKAINNISQVYPTVNIDKYVIMPNHIHMIINLTGNDGRPMVVPTISCIINQLKGYVSKRVGFSMWQARFYEHVIRNQQDYFDILQYIEDNPAKWKDDAFFI